MELGPELSTGGCSSVRKMARSWGLWRKQGAVREKQEGCLRHRSRNKRSPGHPEGHLNSPAKDPPLSVSQVTSLSSRGLVGDQSIQRLGMRKAKEGEERRRLGDWGSSDKTGVRRSVLTSQTSSPRSLGRSWYKYLRVGNEGTPYQGVQESRRETGNQSILKLLGEGSLCPMSLCAPAPNPLPPPPCIL